MFLLWLFWYDTHEVDYHVCPKLLFFMDIFRQVALKSNTVHFLSFLKMYYPGLFVQDFLNWFIHNSQLPKVSVKTTGA